MCAVLDEVQNSHPGTGGRDLKHVRVIVVNEWMGQRRHELSRLGCVPQQVGQSAERLIVSLH